GPRPAADPASAPRDRRGVPTSLRLRREHAGCAARGHLVASSLARSSPATFGVASAVRARPPEWVRPASWKPPDRIERMTAPPNVLDDLQARGLVHTHSEGVRGHLEASPVTAYAG